jgi:guanylate kinase
VRALLARYDRFAFSISATTRPPRGQEQEGKDYYFMDAASFERRVAEGAFLEWEEVYPGKCYGTLRSEVDRILGEGRFPIFDVDVKGGLSLKRQFGSRALAVYIEAPSIEALRERLRRRGTDSPEEIERRCRKALQEMEYRPRFDAVIVNDALDEAVGRFIRLVESHMPLSPSPSPP